MADIINFKNIGFKNKQIDKFILTLRTKLAILCCERNFTLAPVDQFCRSLRDQMKEDVTFSDDTWRSITSSLNYDEAVARFVARIGDQEEFIF